MYIPRYHVMNDDVAITQMIEDIGSAELVTIDADGAPVATLLPLLWDPDARIATFHLARANRQWRSITDGSKALAIVAGAQAYITPRWYRTEEAMPREDRTSVPTWNYSAVHLHGTARVRTDAVWLRSAVTQLTEKYEASRPDPWTEDAVSDRLFDSLLRAIVGIELTVHAVEAKAKLSQNRPREDRLGVIDGLLETGGPPDALVAEQMRALD